MYLSLLLGALQIKTSETARSEIKGFSPHDSTEGTAPCLWSLLTYCQEKGSKEQFGNGKTLLLFASPPHQDRSSVHPSWVTHPPWLDGADGEDAVGAHGARSQMGCRADARCTQHYDCAFVNKQSHGTCARVLEQRFENDQENHVATEVCRLLALPHSLTFSLPFLSFLSLSLCLTEMVTTKAGAEFCSR